jgi:[ribosomal protein S5]-alanine N-acetyltransferase
MTDLAAVFRHLPRLTTPRLVLRPLEMTDAQAIFAYAHDEEVARYVSWPPHRSIEDSRQFLARTLARYADGRPACWGIELQPEVRLIGTAGFVNLNPREGRGEIGYAISRDYWGQGLAAEAVREIIRFGLTELGLSRVEARCHVDNVTSIRLLERCGMSFERIVEPGPLLAGQLPPFRLYAVGRANS